jgi:putative ABC transport system permease protein
MVKGQPADVPSPAAQQQAVVAALRAQPGTLHYVAEADDGVSVLGMSDRLSLVGFTGDASWTGYALITGHWYSGTGEADVNTAFLTQTGTKVGDTYTLTSGSRHLAVRCAPSSRCGRRSARQAAGPGQPRGAFS